MSFKRYAFTVLLLTASLCSCGEKKSEPATKASAAVASSGYDVDLTQLNSQMVYAQVYDMVTKPEDYKGQKVRAKGPFSYFKDDQTGNEYFAVLISDATACCSQGIEFVLDGDHKYPDDYPAMDTEITVSGTFDYYKEGVNIYCQLLDAKIEDSKLSW